MKLNKIQKDIIKVKYKLGYSITKLSKEFNVSTPAIYYITHPEKVKRATSKQVSNSIISSRIKVINLMGGKCVKCGFSDIRALQIDHINGGGRKEQITTGSYKMYLKIINNYDSEKYNYQLLCANCNWIKRYENKEVRNNKLNFNY